MSDQLRVFAGECTTVFEGARDRTQRGRVVVLVKPDRTVLVHDADGYQPVAWLTRPDTLTVETDVPVDATVEEAHDRGDPAADARGNPAADGRSNPAADTANDSTAEGPGDVLESGGFGLTARAGDQTLRVVSHRTFGTARYPVGSAGVPVGRCPACEGALVRTAGDVACLDCEVRHPVPAGATVLDSTCDDCGLPLITAGSSPAVDVCLDRTCETLDDAARQRIDRT